MTDSHALFVRTGPIRQVALHGRVDVDAPLLDELHDRCRHADDFAERRQIPDRVFIRSRAGCPIELTHAIFGDDAIMRTDDRECAGKRAVGAGPVEDALQIGANRVAKPGAADRRLRGECSGAGCGGGMMTSGNKHGGNHCGEKSMHCRVKLLVAVSIASAGCMSRTATTPAPSPSSARVRPGITVLLEDSIALIRGKRVALLTNQTGIDAAGRSDIDLLRDGQAKAAGVTLVRLFSPEHGIRGTEDRERIASGIDERSGLAVHSLYTNTT